MVKNIIIGILLLIGLWCFVSDKLPGIYSPAKRAIKARNVKKSTETQLLQERLAKKIEPKLNIEQVKRNRLQDALSNLGYNETPEHYRATVIAKTIIYTCLSVPFYFFYWAIGLVATILIAFFVYKFENEKIFKELDKRKKEIERELPQFAATIRQALNTTRDISTILKNYSEVAGEALKGEIQKTLNDIFTGNAESAIQSFEQRISSAELSKLTRSLIAISRGDDQRAFLDGLTNEYRKTQNAQMEKELLLRPSKLNPYLAALFVCFLLLVGASLGQAIFSGINQIF